MADQKLENLLNLALDSTEEERKKSLNLSGGNEGSPRMWDVIIKYSGNIEALTGKGIRAVPLLGGYAVLTLLEQQIREVSKLPQVEFMELPKRLYFQVSQGLEASCIRSVQEEGPYNPGQREGILPESMGKGLSGQGI